MPRKRNFYKNALADSEQHFVASASSVQGLDDEIILLRVKIKSLLSAKPCDYGEVLQTANILGRLMKVRNTDPFSRQKNLKEDVQSVLKEIALPLQISLYNQKVEKEDPSR